MKTSAEPPICDVTAFMAMTAAFEDARAALGGASQDVHLSMFGCTVRVRVAGGRLAAEIMPALAHLARDEAGEASAEMTIELGTRKKVAFPRRSRPRTPAWGRWGSFMPRRTGVTSPRSATTA